MVTCLSCGYAGDEAAQSPWRDCQEAWGIGGVAWRMDYQFRTGSALPQTLVRGGSVQG